jgi:hypothetical protein
MEDCTPSIFLGSWVLVILYLCFKICIFDRPILEEYVFKVEQGPHFLQFCFCATRINFLPIIREMDPSFESLLISYTVDL